MAWTGSGNFPDRSASPPEPSTFDCAQCEAEWDAVHLAFCDECDCPLCPDCIDRHDGLCDHCHIMEMCEEPEDEA